MIIPPPCLCRAAGSAAAASRGAELWVRRLSQPPYNPPLKIRSYLNNVRSTKGFTLIEVVFALALMALLVGGMVTMMNATMQAAAELQAREARNQKVAGLIVLCQRVFRTLPLNAGLEGRIREENGIYLPEILFHNAPETLAWGSSAESLATTVIGAKIQLGGLLNLSLFHEETSTDLLEAKKPPSLTLLSDLRKLQWRFYDPRSQTWAKDWTDTNFRPSLVELTFEIAGEGTPTRAVFWLPTLSKPTPGTPANSPPPPPAPLR